MGLIRVRASRRAKAYVRSTRRNLAHVSKLRDKAMRSLRKENAKLPHMWSPSARKNALNKRLAVINKHVDRLFREKQVRSWTGR